MTDPSLPQILNFGSNTSILTPHESSQLVPSHLVPAVSPETIRPRSNNRLSAHKRIKPTIDHQHSLIQLDQAKQTVHKFVDDVLNENPLLYGYSLYYQKVETICKFKHSEQSQLSDFVASKIQAYFDNHIKQELTTLLENDSLLVTSFVTEYLRIYDNWEQKLRVLSKIFLYLDRGYLLPHPKKKMILELGIDLFSVNLNFLGDKIINKFILFLESFLRHEDTDNKPLVVGFLQMLVKIDFNNSYKLNESLIEKITKVFETFKQEWLTDPASYVHTALTKISQVVTLVKDSGHASDFVDSLLLRLKWVMIFRDFNDILHTCFKHIINSANTKQICIIYKFCQSTQDNYGYDSLSVLNYQWGQYIKEEVNRVISLHMDNINDKTAIITELYQMNTQFISIVKEKFDKNADFEFEVRNSFAKALNDNKPINSYVSIQLGKFVDAYVKNKKSLESGDFEIQFLTLFKFLNNKTEFLTMYKRELSKRLLLSRTNFEVDKRLADEILKVVGETDVCIDISSMFKDLRISRSKYSKMAFSREIEFNAVVLERKHWPEMPKLNLVKLPLKFSSILASFSDYYKTADEKSANHALDWQNYSLHQLTLTGNYASGEYELTVNLYQAIILEMLNQNPQWQLQELADCLEIEPKLLKRVVHSLSDKYKLVNFDNDVISTNKQFTEKTKKLKFPMLRDKDTNVTEERTASRNRNNEIRSCLMRIMKVETKLPMKQLLNKCIVLLSDRGPIAVNELKVNIEYLISNEYLARDDDGRNLVYVP